MRTRHDTHTELPLTTAPTGTLTAASPFAAYLRVPLSWYHSATFAHLPDETHRSIRRTFASPFAPGSHRSVFCGYCGTPLSAWTEREPQLADTICLTLGSLLEEDLGRLEEWGLLPGDEESEDEDAAGGVTHIGHQSQQQPGQQRQQQLQLQEQPRLRGAPWFESLVGDSRLGGRIRRQRGGQTSRDGNVSVEWEVVEWSGGDAGEEVGAAPSPGKRKIGEVEVEGDDAEMRL